MQAQKMLGRALLLGTTLLALGCNREDNNPGTGLSYVASGSIKASIDGSSFSGTRNVIGLWQGTVKTLQIGAQDANGTGIWFTVPNAFGTGEYAAIPGTPIAGSVSVGAGQVWQSNIQGGTGTITITELSGSGAKGTFSFVGVPQAGSTATGTRTVTNGSFDIEFKN